MKRMIGVMLLFAALGAWAGAYASQSPSLAMKAQGAVAILFAANLLFATWVWSRARAGSIEAESFPDIMVITAAMLVGLVPRLFWPDNDAVVIGAMTVSVVIIFYTVISSFRRNRRLRAARRVADL